MLSIGPPPPQRPAWTLEDLIGEIRQRCYEMGRSPLEFFDLDLRRQAVPGVWRPSRSMRCRRYNCYKAAGIAGFQPPWDPIREAIFDRGHVFGAWAAAYLAAGQYTHGFSAFAQEVVCHNEQLDLGGKADIVFAHEARRYAVEVKSKTSVKALRGLKEPDEAHAIQLNDYLTAEGLESGFVLYICLDEVGAGHEVVFKDFWLPRSEALAQKTRDSLVSLKMYHERPDVVPAADGNPWFECKACPYVSFCGMNLSVQAAKERFG